MPWPSPPSSWSSAIFCLIVASVCVFFLWALRKSVPERLPLGVVAVLAWLALAAGIAESGVLVSEQMPPPLMIFMISTMIGTIALAMSPLGERMSQAVPIAALVGVQSFRLPLELVLHQWYTEGALPIQMTFHGHNFDIATGILAVLCGIHLHRRGPSRHLVLGFNVVGFSLLMVVIVIAVTSSPIPLRLYEVEPVLVLAFHAPHVWIMTICVAGALFFHIVTFRWLRSTRGSHRDH